MRVAIDLFAGAGGATQGLRNAGFEVVAAVEKDRDAAATWRANHPGKMLDDDIRAVSLAQLKSAVPRGRKLDLLKACPPCQGFSTLRGQEVDENRNDLVLDTLRLIDALEPIAILLENVPGLRRDARFGTLTHGIATRGYALHHYLIDASELGVPQRRRRLVVIAVDEELGATPPAELDALIPQSHRRPALTAGQALDELRQNLAPVDKWNRWRKSSDSVRERITAVPLNGTRLDLPAAQQLACHSKLQGKRVALASYGRIKADRVAPTMTTRCTTPSCGTFIHPTENRGLSIREAAAFQTFPPDYSWVGGYDSVERQIGNAVPVTMAEELGRAVLRLLGG